MDGYVVPIRSPDAIAEKLELLYSDRSKALHMGENAVAKVKSLYDWRGCTEELIEIYRSAISAA